MIDIKNNVEMSLIFMYARLYTEKLYVSLPIGFYIKACEFSTLEY